MARVLWVTDPHLDCVRGDAPRVFGQYLRQENPDAEALLITGDIAQANTFSSMLEGLAKSTGLPLYFVLGNHDAYGGSLYAARKAARGVKGAHWLPAAGVVAFGETALVGQDGWYDGRLGAGSASKFLLNDFSRIKELRLEYMPRARRMGASMTIFGGLPEHMRREVLNPVVLLAGKIADAEAEAAKKTLQSAVGQGFKKIVFATHVPPFEGAAWHQGEPSDHDALPWFASKVMGEAILSVAQQAPDVAFIVLCGHSHSPGTCDPAPNVHVLTGKAVYGSPYLAGTLDLV